MTRYEKYVLQQARYTRRRRRKNRHNQGISPPKGGHNGGGKEWFFNEGPLQTPCDVHNSRKAPFWVWGPLAPEIAHLRYTATPDIPPHFRITDAFYRSRYDAGHHEQRRLFRGHCRRAHYIGHKVGRMNGRQRQVMGAWWRFQNTGFYPTWDPDQRQPANPAVD